MMALNVLAASFLTACAAGVIASATLPDRRVPAVLACTGSAMAMMLMAIGLTVLATGHLWSATLWTVAPFGALTLEVDRLAAVFITAMGLVCLPVSLFSAGYLLRYLGRYSLRSFGILYHGLLAAIALTLATSDVLAFLLAWEAMAILSYFLVNYEHEQREHTHAGYLMLVMGEAGTVAVMVAFLLLINAAGGLPFAALRHAAATAGVQTRWAVFLLSFFGFGVKAGLLPGSSWLPRAHPAAPANVSAVLSGVILNLGLYGIIRVNLDLLPAHLVGPGIVVLVVGSLSALVGILYATTQNDLKAMLAHSSIENIGIVTASLGAGLVFGASGEATLASMAYVAALYHMVNHSAYKGLLFLGAGAVDGGAGERHMDRLGGLIRRMPWTAMFFLVGALAIAAMPPFNGFASEWLTLQTLRRGPRLDGVARGDLLCEDLCDELPGVAPFRRRRVRARSGPYRAGGHGDPGGGVPRARHPADLHDPRAERRRGAADPRERRGRPRSVVLRARNAGARPARVIRSRLSHAWSAGRPAPAAGPRAHRIASRRDR